MFITKRPSDLQRGETTDRGTAGSSNASRPVTRAFLTRELRKLDARLDRAHQRADRMLAALKKD